MVSSLNCFKSLKPYPAANAVIPCDRAAFVISDPGERGPSRRAAHTQASSGGAARRSSERGI